MTQDREGDSLFRSCRRQTSVETRPGGEHQTGGMNEGGKSKEVACGCINLVSSDSLRVRYTHQKKIKYIKKE